VLAGFERAVLRGRRGRRNAALLLLSVFRKRACRRLPHSCCLSSGGCPGWPGRQSDSQPWWQEQFDFDDDDDDVRLSIGADIGLDADRERSWLRRLIGLGRAALRHNSKLRRVFALARRSKEPLAIFTEFKDSLDALAARLQCARRIAALHGRLTSDEQQHQIGRFLDGSASILLATDVASQGSICNRAADGSSISSAWNPATLEQRAGRVDRIGQSRPVHISLLVAAHQAEAGVLVRLARRTLSAQQTLGPDALRVAAPDEHVLRAHLLSNTPLPAPERASSRPEKRGGPARRAPGSAARDGRAKNPLGPLAFPATCGPFLRGPSGPNGRTSAARR
jgi:hypothetical protein